MNELIRDILDATAPALNALVATPVTHLVGGLMTVIGLGILMQFLRLRRRASEQQVEEARLAKEAEFAAQHQAEVELLEQRLKSQDSALLLMGERVQALEEYLEMLGSKQQRLEADKKSPHFYQHLRLLAHKGVSAVELAQRFGISASEASLIAAMNRKAG